MRIIQKVTHTCDMCALFLSEVCDGDVLLDNTFKLLGPDGLDQS